MPHEVSPHVEQLDLRGLHCPQTLIRSRAIMATMTDGSHLSIRCSEADSYRQIPILAARMGAELLKVTGQGGCYEFHLRIHNSTTERGGLLRIRDSMMSWFAEQFRPSLVFAP